MPRDKELSHQRILTAASQEFLTHGYDGASIRAIAQTAGVTSAALYRHFASKEDMFAAVVEPGLTALARWQDAHRREAYTAVSTNNQQAAAGRSEADMIREVVLPHRRCFKLLLCCAQGTRFDHFVDTLVQQQQAELISAVTFMRDAGFTVPVICENDIHVILSAWFCALFEPIVHDYDDTEALRCVSAVEQFFLPGWHNLLGITGP